MRDFDLYRLWGGGHTGPVYLCDLPSAIARRLGAFSGDVFVSAEDMAKMRFKHKLKPSHFPLLALALRYGWLGIDPKRPKHLLVIYSDREITGKTFKAVVKATGEGHELYLETFHRCKPEQFRSAVKRSVMIRDQIEDMGLELEN